MFANSLPEEIGAIAFLIDPVKVSDPAGYRKALKYLAENTPSDWVKYVVLDDRIERDTEELLEQMAEVKMQSMYLPPEELEKRVKWHLATGIAVGPVERRIYTGLLGSFALARQEYDESLRFSREQLALTEPEGTPNDLAAVHYNIGNAHLAKEDYSAAAESFTAALDLAMQAGLSAIVPSVLCNLGVTLFHAGEREQANECFEASRLLPEAQPAADRSTRPRLHGPVPHGRESARRGRAVLEGSTGEIRRDHRPADEDSPATVDGS